MTLDNLRSELTKMEVRFEMQMNQTKQAESTNIADILSKIRTDIRNDFALLKKRQDQLFQKQDQIQCTLARETPPASSIHTFRSPSASSVLAWSSIPSHTPGRLSSNPPQQVAGIMQQEVYPLHNPVVPSVESSDYIYDMSFLDEEAYQSSISDIAEHKSDLGTLLAETLGDGATQPPAQLSHSLGRF